MSRLWPNSGSQIGNESLASMTQAGWNVALCPIHAAEDFAIPRLPNPKPSDANLKRWYKFLVGHSCNHRESSSIHSKAPFKVAWRES